MAAPMEMKDNFDMADDIVGWSPHQDARVVRDINGKKYRVRARAPRGSYGKVRFIFSNGLQLCVQRSTFVAIVFPAIALYYFSGEIVWCGTSLCDVRTVPKCFIRKRFSAS